ncbi:DNA-protecting protein DprA [Candidatus Woesebacteria bacterium]|nr:MAG: DNA-protecting protein DprA [Candidatus Woesebacteria bacterium]
MTENDFLVCISTYVGFGPVRLTLLKNYFGTYENIWKLSKKELKEVNLSDKLIDGFVEHRKNFDFDKYQLKLAKLAIGIITHSDANYPSNLSELSNAPQVLYIKGELCQNDSNAIAIVGSRKMTHYGREVAAKFAGELSDFGVTIVSGLALGIDAVAHNACLASGGRSIAVLASGLDTITPQQNYYIAKKIFDGKKGAIVSEYPLGTPALKTNFANRNRIISGLSKAVIVVEGQHKSGTLLTARAAAEQGRTVFAVPGQITSPMSEAPLYLIENGARLATSTRVVLEEMNMQFKVDKKQVEKIMPTDELERKIYILLKNEAKHIDEIAREIKLDIGKLQSKLSMMELKGLVNCDDGLYRVRN